MKRGTIIISAILVYVLLPVIVSRLIWRSPFILTYLLSKNKKVKRDCLKIILFWADFKVM